MKGGAREWCETREATSDVKQDGAKVWTGKNCVWMEGGRGEEKMMQNKRVGGREEGKEGREGQMGDRVEMQ